VRPIRIQNLVPDLSMSSFEGRKIDFSEIELQDKIGEGGAAIVFKGSFSISFFHSQHQSSLEEKETITR
jgi:hypothetical protein